MSCVLTRWKKIPLHYCQLKVKIQQALRIWDSPPMQLYGTLSKVESKCEQFMTLQPFPNLNQVFVTVNMTSLMFL